ncbi:MULTISPECIES: GntR family transcriptional regulator [unclassified Adlercreutzia]|uniref:GntR family transcriptional regulator n=1 Tax=unclassified Adlercreutzia TaxID=2636013 RepID=UPI001F15170A|nr:MULTISPECIES: GntR family transcriptional regulator [unclassified Adlercreutzia]
MIKLKKIVPAADLFELDERSSIPIWLQLKNRFIYLITSGYYMPGDQLPTVRGLAADVEINYNTVSKVYQSLEEDGYIQSKRRQGAFVCDVSNKPGVSIAVTAEIITVEYIQRCQELGMSLDDIGMQFSTSLSKLRRADKGETNESEGTKAENRWNVVAFPEPENGSTTRTAGSGA